MNANFRRHRAFRAEDRWIVLVLDEEADEAG